MEVAWRGDAQGAIQLWVRGGVCKDDTDDSACEAVRVPAGSVRGWSALMHVGGTSRRLSATPSALINCVRVSKDM